MSFRDLPLKAHNPRVEARRESRDIWPKMAFLGSKWLLELTVRLWGRETGRETSGKRRITKRLLGKRKKAGVMTTPAFSFTRG